MQVNASIDETDIGRIKTGQKAFFTVDAFADRQFGGRLTQIRKAPIRRGNVVTYTVIIKSGNPDGVLLPGMTALLEMIVMGTGEILK